MSRESILRILEVEAEAEAIIARARAEAKETLAEVGFTANQIRLLTEQESGEYVVKFKIVEVYERVKNYFAKS